MKWLLTLRVTGLFLFFHLKIKCIILDKLCKFKPIICDKSKTIHLLQHSHSYPKWVAFFLERWL
ncbi:hypothetical protein BSG1_07666 [Bacillus sp. SG-1]|nr:hypothetical protein BSG1_07666 [Bacillus sp. SG-1]